jgi:PTS system nitrogen regulatory IIA component
MQITMKMSIEEIGQCLGLPSTTIDRWIRQGRIPIRRVGTKCEVHQSTIEKWAKQHQLRFSLPDHNDQVQSEPEFDSLSKAIQRGGIFYQVTGHDMPSVLQHAVQYIPDLSVDRQKDLCTKLLNREEMASTGLGKGVAIPHPRSPIKEYIKQAMITTCFLEKPVPYKAIDDQPVFVLFILLSPSTQNHLHLLSRLAFCLRDNQFVEFLAATPNPDALTEKIIQVEQIIDRTETE